jgi:hypothetical protein
MEEKNIGKSQSYENQNQESSSVATCCSAFIDTVRLLTNFEESMLFQKELLNFVAQVNSIHK